MGLQWYSEVFPVPISLCLLSLCVVYPDLHLYLFLSCKLLFTDAMETGTCTTPETTCHSFSGHACGVQCLCVLSVFHT